MFGIIAAKDTKCYILLMPELHIVKATGKMLWTPHRRDGASLDINHEWRNHQGFQKIYLNKSGDLVMKGMLIFYYIKY
jgi:hypothetical protein